MRVWVQGSDAEQARRIAAALRHGGMAVADELSGRIDLVVTLEAGTLAAGDLRIDRIGRTAWRGDRRLRLTAVEFALLLALADAPDGLDRPALLARVWRLPFDPGTNLVAVHVHRLRAKVGAGRIATRRGGGYRLTDAV